MPKASLLWSLSLILGLGCGQEPITRSRIPKERPTTPPDMAGTVPPPPAPTQGTSLVWKLPKGWTETRPGGMRVATLIPPGAPKVDISVTMLPGPAGGELANVNRWRGQIGLPPVEESALPTLRRTLKTAAGPMALYDFTASGNPRSRMVVGLFTTAQGQTWFLKLVGEEGPVGLVHRDFITLLEGVRLG